MEYAETIEATHPQFLGPCSSRSFLIFTKANPLLRSPRTWSFGWPPKVVKWLVMHVTTALLQLYYSFTTAVLQLYESLIQLYYTSKLIGCAAPGP